jgi:hypothetical protein
MEELKKEAEYFIPMRKSIGQSGYKYTKLFRERYINMTDKERFQIKKNFYNNKINKLNEEKEYILKQFNKIPELDNSIKDLQIKLADLSDTLIEITK